MIQSNLAFTIVNQILKVKASKNFFSIEKNSFYAEPLFFYVSDLYVTLQKLSTLKIPKNFGLYSFTTNVQLHHTPMKKIILSDISITYQIYGVRCETCFFVHEICKKPNQTIQKKSYVEREILSAGAANTLIEMENTLKECANNLSLTI